MKIPNRDFTFFSRKKKKQKFPSLEALKLVSFVTGTALAVNKALKERLQNQQLDLRRKKEVQSEEVALIIAGFVGGALAGAVSALLFTPESGGELRKRIAHYFENGNSPLSNLKGATRKAKKKTTQAGKKVNGNT